MNFKLAVLPKMQLHFFHQRHFDSNGSTHVVRDKVIGGYPTFSSSAPDSGNSCTSESCLFNTIIF